MSSEEKEASRHSAIFVVKCCFDVRVAGQLLQRPIGGDGWFASEHAMSHSLNVTFRDFSCASVKSTVSTFATLDNNNK